MVEFTLIGSSVDDLKSSKASKILATAVYGQILLHRRCRHADDTATTTTRSSPSLTPPCDSPGLCLVVTEPSPAGNKPIIQIELVGTSAALRCLANGAGPARGLMGSTAIEAAQVDGWLSYSWSNVDLPLQVALQQQSTSTAAADFTTALTTLNQHLTYQTYLVGHAVTVADIALVCALYAAAQAAVWNPEPTEGTALVHVARWYQTLTHQDWFIQSLELLKSPTSSIIMRSATAPSSSTPSSSISPTAVDGVFLNGVPPAVINQKYRRQRIRIKEILHNAGATYMEQTVTVAGWARTIRKASSKLYFVELNDGSTGASLQCVLDIQKTAGFEECKQNGGTGASFQFVGTIVPSAGSEQAVDMNVTTATLLGAVMGGDLAGTEVGGMYYPMSKKDHTLEHFREHAHLRARTSIHAAAMRVRHAMAYATHTFFHNHGFLYIHTPIITGADCEGAGEQFAITTMLGNDHHQPDIMLPVHKAPEEGQEDVKKLSKSEQKRLAKTKTKEDPNKPSTTEQNIPGAVDYSQDFFAQRVNLTVSGQLNVETHACALSDVYTFGPTFRAEASRTYRHLSEFWMIEPEIAFGDLQQDIDLAEDYLKYCVRFALENCADDLEFFEKNKYGEAGLRDRLRNVLDHEFKRLTYTEAIDILQKAVEEGVVFETKPEWGIDLPSEHERYICEKVFQQPVVLTNYPKEIKAFYMKVNEDGKTVAAADVLVPKIGEIIGGSQREHRLEVLKQRCIEMNLDPRALWWYLDLRRYGTVPHAGFGLGFERLILFVTGLDNIRDVIPFPRWVGNASF